MEHKGLELTAQQSAIVERLMASGRYRTVSELIAAALHLLEREEDQFNLLRSRIGVGLEEARRCAFVEHEGDAAIRNAFAIARGKP